MAVGVVAVLVVGCSPSDPPVEPPPDAPRGQILEIAGGPQWGPVVSTPIPADAMPFSVYATAIRERDGFLYVRDHNKIVRIDPNTSTAQRVAGLGHTVDGIELGTPLNDLLDPAAAGAGNAFLDWSRSFDLGPDGDFYVDAVGAGPFLPPSEGRRIFRIDSVTRKVSLVAGNGAAGPSVVGGPAAASPLDGVSLLRVDPSGAVWFNDHSYPDWYDPSTQRGRRIDPLTGRIDEVVLPPRFFGFDPQGRPLGAVVDSDANGNDIGFHLVARTAADVLVDVSGVVAAPVGDFTSPPVLLVDGSRVLRFPAAWEATPTIHEIDLTSGAVAASPLQGSMLDILQGSPVGDSTYGLLERSMTVTSAGDIAFVARVNDGATETIKVFRWSGETPPLPTPEPPPGTPWSFGDDNEGLLGSGNPAKVVTPTAVPALGDVVQVAAGPGYSLARLSTGDVVAWGYATGGWLGDGTGRRTPTPVRVRGVSGADWIGGGRRPFAIVDGATYTWGSNGICEAGAMSYPPSPTPAVIPSLAGFTEISNDGCRLFGLRPDGTVSGVGTALMGPNGDPPASTPRVLPGVTGVVELAPYATRMARRSDGTVITWGHGGQGVIGDGSDDQAVHGVTTVLTAPGVVLGGSTNPVVSISAASSRRFAVTADGTLWSWGLGAHGDGTTTSLRAFATPIAGIAGATRVSSGHHNVYVHLADGSIVGWGSTIGDGTTTERLTPTHIASGVAAVASSWYGPGCGEHALAVREDQTVVAWGCNVDGAVGAGGPAIRRSAGSLLIDGQLAQVDGTGARAVALTDSGQVLTTGSANFASGVSGAASVGSFVPVPAFDGYEVVDVDTYSQEILAVTSDGAVLTLDTRSAVVTPVSGLPAMARVSAGSGFNVGLDRTGRVWAWGVNSSGQLGRGGFSAGLQPPALVRLANGMPLDQVVALDASRSFGVAARDDGSVWTWGFDAGTYGVLGRPAPVHPTGGGPASPVADRVGGLSEVVDVAAGFWHVLARTGSGSVWAWGGNGGGALGVESPAMSQTPVRVTKVMASGSREPLSGVTDIAAGSDHSLAATSDGVAFGWGVNHRGQLGLKSDQNYFFGATLIASLTGVRSVHAVSSSSYVIADPALHPTAQPGESLGPNPGPSSAAETTDLEGDGAQVGDTIEVRVTRGAAGPVSITETIGVSPPVGGLEMLPVRATVVVPVATAAQPHRVEFRIDRDVTADPLPAADMITAVRDGVPFSGPCPTANSAPPGAACLAAKVTYPDGDLGVVVNVAAVGSSTWSFGL